MIANEDEFFTSGLHHYGTAVRAAEDFKEVLYTRLIELVENHRFNTFSRSEDWRSEISRWAKQSDIYVSIGIPGQLRSEACKLEIGLWWMRSGSASNDLAVYVGLHGEFPWRKKLQPLNTLTKCEVSSTAYLVRNAEASTWASVANELLDELENAASRTLLAR